MPSFALLSLLRLSLLAALLTACASPGERAAAARRHDPASLDAGQAIRDSARHAAASNTATAAWPSQAWWQALHDPQLDRLIAAALDGNPTLKASAARVRQADAIAGLADAATGPRADASASIDRERYSAHGTAPAALAGRYAWRNTATVSASYDLDLWGRNRAALAAALGDVQVASAEARMVALALQSAVAHRYIELAQAWTAHDHASAGVAERERMLEILRRRHAAGLATAIDVAAFETTLPAGRREQEQAHAAIAQLRNALAALIGKGPGDGESIARPLLTALLIDNGTPASVLPSALPAELLGRRPDVAAQRWRIEAATRRVDVATAEFYPNVNLAAFAGFQALGFGHFLGAGSAVRGVAPAVSLPIFDGGRLRSQLGGQEALLDGAIEQYNATVVQALADVADAVDTARSVQEQQRLAGQALAAAERAHGLALKAYRAGFGDALAVNAAQLLVLDERWQLAQAGARGQHNYVALMAALGGGVL